MTAIEFYYPPINELVWTSDAAVIGIVTHVTEPRWNAETDESFSREDTDEGIPAMQYREATVVVERILWSTNELEVGRGDEIEVFLWGDGSNTGSPVAQGVFENNISGPVETDTRSLFILKYFQPFFRDGRSVREERRIGLHGDFLGNWMLQGGTAVNPLPQRTVPADALIARLERERARGRQVGDRTGQFNPLEE